MGIELELLVLLVLMTLGSSIFAVFEVETPRWRKAFENGGVRLDHRAAV